ncbi:MAG: hypothetical protein EXS49_01725 [Candidatus Pacebacteria bacterium]|nr:hypothetical protein [Candidatus Paceibacterota bacterium]
MFSPEFMGGEIAPNNDSAEKDAEVIQDQELILSLGAKEDLEAIRSSLGSFEEISREAQLEEEKKGLDSLRSKVFDAARGFLKQCRSLAIIGSIALGADYQLTHPELEIVGDKDGNLEYIHPDSETTHILNVLSGKEVFTPEEALPYFKTLIEQSANEDNIKLPEDFDSYNIDQVDSFWVAALNEKGTEIKPGTFRDSFYSCQYLNKNSTNTTDRDIYDLTWKMENECGNPKIRIDNETTNISEKLLSQREIYRANYSGPTNTVFLPKNVFFTGNAYEALISELSHSKQLKDDPIGFYYDGASSMIRMFSKGGFDKAQLHSAQLDEYAIPGSLEHQAHSSIEPKLKAKYKKLTNL